jgi:hypothetical protein
MAMQLKSTPPMQAMQPRPPPIGGGGGGGTRLQSFIQFAQAFAIGLTDFTHMLVSTRADASSHSLREPYLYPKVALCVPWGERMLLVATSEAWQRMAIYIVAILQSKVSLAFFSSAFSLLHSNIAPFPLLRAHHHGSHRYCIDVRPSRPVASPGASGCRWPHGHRTEWQSLRYCLFCVHRRVSTWREPSPLPETRD